ncbi:MAG TPA: hypothetical protein V6C71_06235 [Coleofasciculaceae cyanobacterium]|jgi:hypothetical protein
MTDQQSQQFINFSEAKKLSSFIEREADKSSQAEPTQSERELNYEQEEAAHKLAHKLAHKQNIIAHIPGGSAIADLDK